MLEHQPATFRMKHAAERPSNGKLPDPPEPSSILVVDVGGSKVKILASGKSRPRKAASGSSFTPEQLVGAVKRLAQGWQYDAMTIGLPGPVGHHGPQTEPGNLGAGWVGFDFSAAFQVPVKIINDAVMQALGSYEHGRMVFIGFGTGVGSALIADNVIVPMEIGHIPFDSEQTFNDVLSRRGLDTIGKRRWRRAVERFVPILIRTFCADYVVLGGGNAKLIKDVPVGARLGHNLTAFRGGMRLWRKDINWVFAIPNGKADLSEV